MEVRIRLIRPCVSSPLPYKISSAKAKYPDLPNNRTTTRKKGDDFKGWAVFTDGGTHASVGETTAGWGAVVCSPDERHFIMFGPVITTEAHLAYAGAGLHTINTAELSGIIEPLSFLWPAGPVTRGPQACIFYDSQNAPNICLGLTQTRTNVHVGLTSQQLLLQTQLRMRITMQHIYSHRQNLLNECADHAAALSALGFISNQNVFDRWAHPSFDSATLFDACGNLDVFFFKKKILRDVKRTHMPVQQFQFRRQRCVSCPCLSDVFCAPPGSCPL